MANQNHAGPGPDPGPANGNGHRPLDADQGRGHPAAPELQGRSDNGAGRDDHQPETAGRLAPDPFIAAIEGLTKQSHAVECSQWAILKELRAGRKYRKDNPPRLEAVGDMGHCEACGCWLDSFDDLVHHQFHAHPEIFLEPGELPLAAPDCLCRGCNPEAYLAWARTPEGRGAKT